MQVGDDYLAYLVAWGKVQVPRLVWAPVRDLVPTLQGAAPLVGDAYQMVATMEGPMVVLSALDPVQMQELMPVRVQILVLMAEVSARV